MKMNQPLRRAVSLSLASALFFSVVFAQDTIKIACVGNSITQGDWLANPATQGYVALVQKMMGARVRMYNYGLSGRTMLQSASSPYIKESKFADLFTLKPDIITIELGTNESRPSVWTTQTAYEADYSRFIDSLMTITPKHWPHPRILPGLCTPSTDNNGYTINGTIIANQINPSIGKVAKAKGDSCIDLHTPFLPLMNLIWDGVHPDSNGNKVMADLYYENIKNLGLRDTPQTRWLWYGQAPSAGAPSATGNADADKPMLWVYPAPDSLRNGTAVIICPGGGYTGLATTYEGRDEANWFNKFGVTAFVLRYRLSPYHHPVEMNDAKRAVRIVRYYAAKYGIDTMRIGIMGFSAGGHLASTVLTHFDSGNVTDLDPINRKKSRPDFGVLIYPVITLTGPYTHTGSRDALLGTNPSPALLDSLSNQKMVRANTPATFLAHGDADNTVPIQNSKMFDSACKAYNVLDTLVVDPGKGHGYGMGGIWPPILIAWLKGHNIIKTKTVAVDYHKSNTKTSEMRFSIQATKAGIRIKRNSGYTGTIAIYSISGKKVAVMKGGVSEYLFRPACPGCYFAGEEGKGMRAVQAVNFLK